MLNHQIRDLSFHLLELFVNKTLSTALPWHLIDCVRCRQKMKQKNKIFTKKSIFQKVKPKDRKINSLDRSAQPVCCSTFILYFFSVQHCNTMKNFAPFIALIWLSGKGVE